MAITDIRLIDHPTGRRAMYGWVVSTKDGDGIIVDVRHAVDSSSGKAFWRVRVDIKGKVKAYAADTVMTR
jgi:hypothetical protein